jgi:hypothetical protein
MGQDSKFSEMENPIGLAGEDDDLGTGIYILTYEPE